MIISYAKGISPILIIIIIGVLASVIFAGVVVPRLIRGGGDPQDSGLREVGPAVSTEELCRAKCRNDLGGGGTPEYDACVRACVSGAARVVEDDDDTALPPTPPAEPPSSYEEASYALPPPSYGEAGYVPPQPPYSQGGYTPPSSPPAPSEVTVNIQNFAYSSTTLTVSVGSTVRFVNQDSAAHTATADGGSFDTGLLSQGQSKSIVFSTPGTFPYHCTPHTWMRGTIIVE